MSFSGLTSFEVINSHAPLGHFLCQMPHLAPLFSDLGWVGLDIDRCITPDPFSSPECKRKSGLAMQDIGGTLPLGLKGRFYASLVFVSKLREDFTLLFPLCT